MKRLISLFVAGAVIAALGFAQTDLQPAAIVRLTKTEPIMVKQVRTEAEKMVWGQLMQSLNGRRQPTAQEINNVVQGMNMEQKRQVLDIMINDRLAMQAAERDKITVTENEINVQLDQLRAGMTQSIGRRPTDAEFTTAVRNETGQDVPAFREQLRKQLIIQKYLMAKKQDQFKSLADPTDEEIRNTYLLAKAQLVRPDTVRFSMIQIPFTDAASKTAAKVTADRLVREIGSDPAKFDEASARGAAANSGYQAGDGGYLPLNSQAQQMVGAEFLTVAFALNQGEVSKLIENARGYQIIKITET
jgi:parvulin-like peptidyl-prolyl isomerase